jgi:hypothetical protein
MRNEKTINSNKKLLIIKSLIPKFTKGNINALIFSIFEKSIIIDIAGIIREILITSISAAITVKKISSKNNFFSLLLKIKKNFFIKVINLKRIAMLG